MTPAYFNWSGGKDSAFALWQVLKQKEYAIRYLLTSVNKVHDRISMHGVRRALLEKQAAILGIPLTTIELPEQPPMDEYETQLKEKASWLRAQGLTHSIFGDIFLEDLKRYREQQLAALDITCVFPLWKQNTTELINEFINAGFKTIVVCVNDKYLDKSFCGRVIDQSFLNDLPSEVDPCGENGEFHTFVFDGPLFRSPVAVKKGELVYKEYDAPGEDEKYGFWFCGLEEG